LTGLFINNQVKLKKEEGYWKNTPGEMVEVDGHKMHVYTEGEGDHTILEQDRIVQEINDYLNNL